MSIRHYPRNSQSRTDKLTGPGGLKYPTKAGFGPRNIQSGHDGLLQNRPDIDTTNVASTIYGY
jgi:hypothetical protein